MIQSRKADLILRSLLMMLIITSFTSGVRISIPPYNINFSQIVSILLLVFLLAGSVASHLRIPVIFTDWTSLSIYAFFLANLISSVLVSSDVERSTKGCISIFTYVLVYHVARWTMKFMDNHQWVLKRMETINFVSALLGLTCMAASIATGTENIGTTFDQLGTAGIEALSSPVPSIRSLALEPNLFAITCAAVFCFNLSIYLCWKRSTSQLITISILSVALLFSYTRSVYLGLATAVLLMLILSNKIQLLISLMKYLIVIAIIFVGLILYLPDSSPVKIALGARISTLTDFTSGSGLGRVQGYRIGMQGLQESPILGKGTLSAETSVFNIYTNEYQEQFGGPGWLTGTWIQALHDTGMVGFLILLLLYGSIMLANHRAFRRLDDSRIERSVVLGFLGGNTVIIVSSLLSSPLWISFPYIYWAFNLAFLAKCKILSLQSMQTSSD
jgi:hypothetical protein